MLSVCTGGQHTSGRSSRREFLRIGGATIGGLSLPALLAAKASAAGSAVKEMSVVVLNLQGGPTQFETFDPNMQAPAEIRSITGEVKTALPGVTFGGSFPRLATLADKMAVVRSYRHGISSHGPAAMHVMAGGNPTGAMMGALYSRVAGLTNTITGVPKNVLVTSRAMGSQHKELYYNADRVSQTGSLAAAYRPFDPSAGSELLKNMTLQIDNGRLDDRRGLLSGLDVLRRHYDDGQLETANRFQQQAFEVLVRGVAGAFDLSKEDPATVARYDTSHLEPNAGVKQRNSYAKQFSPIALGKQMLLARRLCEAGCGFVTVTSPGWDMHGGGKEYTMVDGLSSLTPAVDRAVSAFIEDVHARGLNDNILLVITGEFGRTPRVNKNGGRDHWGNLCTLAFAGGGLQMGQVIGRSDRTGSRPAGDPISSMNVLATIMHTLFDVGQVRLMTGIPKEVERVITGGQPIRELV
jgi:uncharacterized protein (DUF1501 family)